MMEEKKMMTKTESDRWIRCSNCGHKLMKVIDAKSNDTTKVEIKCSSCKAVTIISIK